MCEFGGETYVFSKLVSFRCKYMYVKFRCVLDNSWAISVNVVAVSALKGTEHLNGPKSLYFILILINQKYVDIYVTECCRRSYKSCFSLNKQLKKTSSPCFPV